MHPKNSHWRNRFRGLLQLSPIVLTSSITTDSALANLPNLLPVPQPESPTPPKPFIRLPLTPEPSPLPTPTPPEALPSPAFSLSRGNKGDRGGREDDSESIVSCSVAGRNPGVISAHSSPLFPTFPNR